MLQKKDKKKLEKVIKEFFKKMAINVDFELREGLSQMAGEEEKSALVLEVKTEEPQLLIGERGKTLSEIQRMLGRLMRKQLGEQIYLDLDINQYKQGKARYLQDLAQESADEVVLNRKEKILPWMSSYERRIIHLELAKRSDVKTESRGQEPERRVVIKPA